MLIKCPDCGKMRSSDAAACPFCGCKRKPGGCSGFIVVLIMLALVTLCDSKEPYVVQRNANFREEPNGKILGQISKGTELSCNIEDGWCRTTYASRIVFVSLKVLEKRTSAGETKSPAPVRNNAEPPVNREAGLVRAVEN